jgi:hypothetical protein
MTVKIGGEPGVISETMASQCDFDLILNLTAFSVMKDFAD